MNSSLILIIAIGGFFALIGLIAFLLVADQRKDEHLSNRAAELLRLGASPQQAYQQLVTEGVGRKNAEMRVRRAAGQAIAASAAELLNKGTPEKEVQEQLNTSKLGSELGPQAVAKVIQFVAHPPWAQQNPLLALFLGVPIMILGLPVAFAGLLIRDNNQTGRHVTFPFAGTLTVILAGCIIACGGYLASFQVYKLMKWDDPLKSDSI